MMWSALVGAILALGGLALATLRFGFAGQRPQDFEGTEPRLDLRRHLNGSIACEGVVFGPFGRVSSRFRGDFFADWIGNTGTMREHFEYDTGRVQDRAWRLSLGSDGSIRGDAADLVGTAHGQQCGSAAVLRYRIRLPSEVGGHVLSATDWMYLTPCGTIVNRSQFRKFGIKVAELVATMRPIET